MSEGTARDQAREMWSRHPAGANYVEAQRGTPVFFEEMRRTRYSLQPWHPAILERFSGEQLLEIGCGAGSDLSMLGRRFRYSIGIDLADEGARLATGSLAYWGMPGAALVADGERLPFADESFDLAYSFGVIHHTDDPEAVIRESWRVLRPGGRALVAVYHRWSMFTALKVAQFLLRGEFMRFGWSESKRRIEAGALEEGLRPKVVLYSRRGLRSLLHDFREVRIETVHAGVGGIPRSLEPHLSSRFGWYLVAEATK